MLNGISRMRAVGVWIALVVVLMAVSLVAGVALTVSNGTLWLVAGLAPPAVMLLVWRGAPPATVAELLHAVNRSSEDGRRG
jgi:hypothetical protein